MLIKRFIQSHYYFIQLTAENKESSEWLTDFCNARCPQEITNNLKNREIKSIILRTTNRVSTDIKTLKSILKTGIAMFTNIDNNVCLANIELSKIEFN